MFLQRKIDRAVRWSRERKLREQGRDPEQEALDEELENHGKGTWKQESPLPSMEEIRREEEQMGLTPKDMFSLIFSGMITILPVVIGVLALLFLVVYLEYETQLRCIDEKRLFTIPFMSKF